PVLGDVVQIWGMIEAVPPPPMKPFPQYSGSTPSPSPEVVSLGDKKMWKNLGGWTIVLASLILLFYAPGLFWLTGLGIWGASRLIKSELGDAANIEKAY